MVKDQLLHSTVQCGKTINYLSWNQLFTTFPSKNVAFTIFLKVWERIIVISIFQCTIWFAHFTVTLFWQKFRESNVFTNNGITKELVWRNIFSVTVNFSFPHLFHKKQEKCKIYSHRKNISSNQLFSAVTSLEKRWFHGKVAKKVWE